MKYSYEKKTTNRVINCVVSYWVPTARVTTTVQTVQYSVFLYPLVATSISSLGHYATYKTRLREIHL